MYSDNWLDHLRDLERELTAIDKAGLTIKRDKCKFGAVYVNYLGHRVGGGKVAVPSQRATAMAEYPRPKTKKQLRSFLGSANYYRRFIKNYADLSSVLTPATSSAGEKVVRWTNSMDSAFCKLRGALCNVVVLHVPQQGDKFVLHTDASGQGLGAVLNVKRGDDILPVAYYSKQLRGPELNYSITELETLAIV